jgi:nitrogen regulatory protein PII
MKEIKAFKREAVTPALPEIEGIQGAGFSTALGFGRGKAESSNYSSDIDIAGSSKHTKVEVVCEDTLEAQVVAAIHHATHTGLRGDGRIFVSDVGRSVRIQEVPEDVS